MSRENKISDLQELARNLRHGGFTVGPETADGLLPVDLDDRRLCEVLDTGGVRYQREDAADDLRRDALDRVIEIAGTTREYMSSLEAAPPLTAEGLSGDYRLLAEFNGVVLAGHPTQLGAQFITWGRGTDQSSLHHGSYYGPGCGDKCYLAAKQQFAVRSGLIPRGALFTQEQLAEVYCGIQETLEAEEALTEERRKRLESIAEQIEQSVPDLEARTALFSQKEAAPEDVESPQDSGMRFS